MTSRAARIPMTAILGAFLLGGGCRDRGHAAGDAPSKAVVENVARTLQNEVVSNVGEKPPAAHSDEIDTGTGRWTSSFEEKTPVSNEGVTRRPFRLVIRNRSNSPQKFESRIEYVDRDGVAIRTRMLPDAVIPPYSDKTFDDALAVPDKVGTRIVGARPEIARIPWDQTR